MEINPNDYEIIHIRDPEADKFVKISSNRTYELRASLIEFLNDKFKLFAWKVEDMLGIDPEIISHELYVDHTKKIVQ